MAQHNDKKGIYLPMCQARPKSVLLYHYYSEPHKGWNNLTLVREEGRLKTYTGLVSKNMAKKIRRTAEIFAMKVIPKWVENPVTGQRYLFRLAFITLTIPEQSNVTHAQIMKNCLAQFLRFLRHRNARYIWKVELQANGMPHYHITIDQFIYYKDLEKFWNRRLKKAGLLIDWFKRHGHYNPPSTEIRAVRNFDDIGKYLAKYIAKASETPIPGGGKVWGCSEDLQNAKYFEFEPTLENERGLNEAPKIELEKCTVFQTEPIKIMDVLQKAEFRRWKHS